MDENKAKKPFYKRTWFIVLCVLFVLGGIGSCMDDGTEEPASTSDISSSTQDTLQTEESEQDAEPSSITESQAEESASEVLEFSDIQARPETPLGVTLTEFQDRFNTNLVALGVNEQLHGIEKDEEGTSAMGVVNDNLGFTFTTVPGSDEISSIVFIGTGDGTEESGVNVMLSMSSVLTAVNPNIAFEDTGTILLELLEGDEGASQEIDGVKYTVSQSPVIGTLLTVEVASQPESEQETQSEPVPESVSESVPELEPESTPEPVPAPKPEPVSTVEPAPVTSDIRAAYWTSGGKSYHLSSSCTSLKRSKSISSGTLQEALNLGKTDPCNLCAGG